MSYILSLGKKVESAPNPIRSDPGLVEQGKGLIEKKNCLFCHILNAEKEAQGLPAQSAQKVALTKNGAK